MEVKIILLRGWGLGVVRQTVMGEKVVLHRAMGFNVKANWIFMEQKIVSLRGWGFEIKVLELLGFMVIRQTIMEEDVASHRV
ncbi:hypothetical protein BGZ83_003821 [Gryganskiella cystojenkinii]|nr:hypothetical protein BGZ83_003821 [Gryganskiella cystojenkinii]